jgi:hypothetical protein
MTQDIPQLSDDIDLLHEMMRDHDTAPQPYQATNYWAYYARRFVPELASTGLRDFRRRGSGVLLSVGAADFPSTKAFQDPRWYEPSDFQNYFYWHVKQKFDEEGYDLRKAATNLLGNPEEIFMVSGQTWTLSQLQYCKWFVDAATFMKPGRDFVVCELGAGNGKNVGIWARLFPDASFLVLDIPPQLYILNYTESVVNQDVPRPHDWIPRIASPETFGRNPGQNHRITHVEAARVSLLWRRYLLEFRIIPRDGTGGGG